MGRANGQAAPVEDLILLRRSPLETLIRGEGESTRQRKALPASLLISARALGSTFGRLLADIRPSRRATTSRLNPKPQVRILRNE